MKVFFRPVRELFAEAILEQREITNLSDIDPVGQFQLFYQGKDGRHPDWNESYIVLNGGTPIGYINANIIA